MLKFSCDGCVFSVMQDNKQIGCQAQRLEFLVDHLENSYMEFDNKLMATYDKFCGHHRSEQWLNSLKPNESALEKLTEEKRNFKPYIGYAISFEEDIETLKTTLNSINNPMYISVFYKRAEYADEITQLLEEKCNNCPYYLTFLIRDLPFQEIADAVLHKVKKPNFITLINSGYALPKNFTEIISNKLDNNIRLGVSFDQAKTKLLVQSRLFNFIGGNKPKVNEDGTVDTRDFYERLASYPIKDKNLITPWENLFNE